MTIKARLAELASTLAAYEKHPYDDETASAVDCANCELREQHSQDPLVEALLTVVDGSLEEDGFGYIPAARVLCAAILDTL